MIQEVKIKKCKVCGEEKPIDQFRWHSNNKIKTGGSFQARCKECDNNRCRVYYQQHREERDACRRKWFNNNLSSLRCYRRKSDQRTIICLSNRYVKKLIREKYNNIFKGDGIQTINITDKLIESYREQIELTRKLKRQLKLMTNESTTNS